MPRPPQALTLPQAIAGIVPASTRERILLAALQVLNEEGFGALTQTRVCRVAGLRQSHLTYYFPTRLDLLREAAAYGCEAMLGAVTRGIDEGVVTAGNMRATLNLDASDRRWARLFAALVAASDEDPSIKPWLAELNRKARSTLLRDLRRLGLDVSPSEVELLYATYMGAVHLELGESTRSSLARARRVVAAAFDRLAPARARKTPAKRGSR